ncbi:MAG: DUF4440 domain-containing protein [Pseudomonas sp.]
MDEALCQHLREREQRLLEPAVRASRRALETLLDPQFVEYGASGRRFERADIVAELAGEASFECFAEDFEFLALAPDVVQVRYVSSVRRGGGPVCRARRSSLWRHGEAGWRIVFHQGTPIPGPA